MKSYKFYKPHPKSQSACLWFCSMNALTSYKSHPKSQMPVFDSVAWVCVQVSQVSPRCPKWPVFDFVAWIPLQNFTSQLKVSVKIPLSRVFPLTISHHYRIKIWWIQRKMILWKWYYYRIKNLNSTIFYIWFLFTKSKTHTCWAKRVSGELSFTESNSFPLTISKPLQNQDLKIWH